MKIKKSKFLLGLLLMRHWLKVFGPIGVVIICGAAFYGNAIYTSIKATPHPALVYMIFAGLGVGLFYTGAVLVTILLENRQLRLWREASEEEHVIFLEKLPTDSHLMPLFQLMHGPKNMPGRMRQAALDSELDEVERTLIEGLSLPNYISAALVGLGLVGTFVGLLGTLEDLGKLFSSLSGAGNAAGGDPAALFGDMVRRLQQPMQGMGTAFIASLYGLLGSILLGLTVLLARSTALEVVGKMRDAVRVQGYGADNFERRQGPQVADIGNLETLRIEGDRWATYLSNIREQHHQFLEESAFQRRKMTDMLNAVDELIVAVNSRSELDDYIKRLMGNGAHWIDSWAQMNEQLRQMRQMQETQGRDSYQIQSDQLNLLRESAQVLSRINEEETSRTGKILTALTQKTDHSEAHIRGVVEVARQLESSLQACRNEFEHAVSLLTSSLSILRDVSSDGERIFKNERYS